VKKQMAKITKDYPKCEHCGQKLVIEDEYDIDCNLAYATACCIGTCPKCNVTYQWIAGYDVTYEGFMGLMETEGD
jgi:hypothetical protein